ncbi:hypothetical protein D3C86_1948450 [compost metagenome]
MLNILLLRRIKLAFVPICNIYKSAINNCDNNGSLSGIFAFENSHDLTNLRAAPSIHEDHLRIQFCENFHAVRCNSYCMFKVSTQ